MPPQCSFLGAHGKPGGGLVPASRWGRGSQCEARRQVGKRHGQASDWEDHGAGFCFLLCFQAKQLLTFTGTKAFKEGPMAFTDAARFLQQPSAPRMQCTALGPPGMALGASPALSSPLGPPSPFQGLPSARPPSPSIGGGPEHHSRALLLPSRQFSMQTRVLSPRRALEAPETDAGGGSLAASPERGGGQGLSLRKPGRLARGVLTMLSAARSSCSWYRAA